MSSATTIGWAATIVRRPLADLLFEPDNKDFFLLMDKDGVCQRIPLHRVREVYRNGELIWQRAGSIMMTQGLLSWSDGQAGKFETAFFPCQKTAATIPWYTS